MAKVIIENGVLCYKKMFREVNVQTSAIVWGYLQLEDVKASMCCGGFNSVIGRAIFQEADGTKHVFQYEGKEHAMELLEQMKEANPDMAVGFTEENRKRFQ